MSGAILRVRTDVPMREILRHLQADDVMGVLSWAAYLALRAELGDDDSAAMRELLAAAARMGKPIGLNVEAPDGSAQTVILAPEGWTPERLAGYVAGRHDELEAAFGRVASVEAVEGDRGPEPWPLISP